MPRTYFSANPMSDRLNSKYTKWMADLTEDQLTGLLWLVGEFAARSSGRDYSIDKESYGGSRRKVAALKAIADFRHHPMGEDDVRRYIQETLRDGDTAAIKRRLEGMATVVNRSLGPGGNAEKGLGWVKDQLMLLKKELEDSKGSE